ncbi:MAG: hypothetical protein AAFR49_15505 [Pseudomonadota bacterium]
MLRRAILAGVAMLPALAFADGMSDPKTVQLTAGQIDELLRGNTIRGTWNGDPYTQFFDANGQTIYFPEGGRPDPGKWRVNGDTDQYESWWERTNWTGYTIMMTNDGFAWVSRGELQPFEVFEGKQVTW